MWPFCFRYRNNWPMAHHIITNMWEIAKQYSLLSFQQDEFGSNRGGGVKGTQQLNINLGSKVILDPPE